MLRTRRPSRGGLRGVGLPVPAPLAGPGHEGIFVEATCVGAGTNTTARTRPRTTCRLARRRKPMLDDTPPIAHRETASSLAGRMRALVVPGRPLLLASDIDGVLAPIVRDRHRARASPAALAALASLRARSDVVTCVVTGRTLEDARGVLGEAGARAASVIVAEHGAAWVEPDGARHDEPMSASQVASLAAFTPHAAAFAAAYPGASLEHKPTALAVHVRGVPPGAMRARADAGLAALAEVAQRLGLASITGRAVLEVRPPLADKGAALLRVKTRFAPESAVVYAGDDTTDEPAIVLAASQGLGVYVASAERPDPPAIPSGTVVVTDQPTWVEALSLLAAQL